MQNPFPYSLDNKRYHTYNYYLKKRYHQKVAKIGLDAGFTCPNRDGKVGVGGCIYCSGDFVRQPSGTDLIRQLTAGCEIMRHKWPQCLFIPTLPVKKRKNPLVERVFHYIYKICT